MCPGDKNQIYAVHQILCVYFSEKKLSVDFQTPIWQLYTIKFNIDNNKIWKSMKKWGPFRIGASLSLWAFSDPLLIGCEKSRDN